MAWGDRGWKLNEGVHEGQKDDRSTDGPLLKAGPAAVILTNVPWLETPRSELLTWRLPLRRPTPAGSRLEDELRGALQPSQMETRASILLEAHVLCWAPQGRPWRLHSHAEIPEFQRPTRPPWEPESVNYDPGLRSWWKLGGHPRRHLNICSLVQPPLPAVRYT